MLCPNVMTVGDMLCDAYSNTKKVDSFVYGCMNTSVGYLNPDPTWLSQLRTRMSILRDTCALWQRDKSDIWSQLLLPFVNYCTTFNGFTEASKGFGNNKDVWISALEQLKIGLEQGKNTAQCAENQFANHIKGLQYIKSLLNSSVDDAWAALADEESQMIAIASELTHLQDEINQLQTNITSSEISSGKSYMQSVVSISYSILIQGSTGIPYLTIAGLVLTIGKSLFDMVSNNENIKNSLLKIADLQVKAKQEAQAAAATKAIIQLLTSLEYNLIELKGKMPSFSEMWSEEIEKIQQAINAINSGVDPCIYIDLKSMPTALATWKTLADYVPKLIKGPEDSKPVELIIK